MTTDLPDVNVLAALHLNGHPHALTALDFRVELSRFPVSIWDVGARHAVGASSVT